jgi:hypothetical protein
MNQQQERALLAGLKALAETTRHASASQSVERAVFAEMARARRRSPPNRRWLSLAAALVIVSGAGAWLAQLSAPQPAATVRPQGFVEIPGAWMLPPVESGSIVRVALAVTELPSYGIPIIPELGAGPVEADLFIAQDGHARAIRLVNETHASRSTP